MALRMAVALQPTPALLRAVGTSGWHRCLASDAAPSAAQQLNFCIVGSGPAGFYTADKVRMTRKVYRSIGKGRPRNGGGEVADHPAATARPRPP